MVPDKDGNRTMNNADANPKLSAALPSTVHGVY